MTATIINGTYLAKNLLENISIKAKYLSMKGCRPGLAVILVGNLPENEIYVQNKIKACKNYGLYSLCKRYPTTFLESNLIKEIFKLNYNKKIHGILVQLPLPKHINVARIIKSIKPEKDVDGFHMSYLGIENIKKQTILPCTPAGILKIFEEYNIPIIGSNVVIIGKSIVVGKPMAILLIDSGATVTICHSRTKNLGFHTNNADIIISAVGKPGLLTSNMVKNGATVIDVGISYNSDGKLSGDVNFNEVKKIAKYITPVPGGVGPMTIAMLLNNTVNSAIAKFNK